MDTFLQTYNLPTLNQDNTESLNSPITNKEIESIIKKKNKIENPGPHGFPGEFCQIFEVLLSILFKLIQKTE